MKDFNTIEPKFKSLLSFEYQFEAFLSELNNFAEVIVTSPKNSNPYNG